MMKNAVQCDIEHHAIMFACMAKAIFDACPDDAEQMLRTAVRTYGAERGARMAARCLRNGDVCTNLLPHQDDELQWRLRFATPINRKSMM